MKKMIGTLGVLGMVVVGISGVSPPASASTECGATVIIINATPGGEPRSSAHGHSHRTGKHYVAAITSSRLWYWNADNDNGRDDKPDTPYGIRQC